MRRLAAVLLGSGLCVCALALPAAAHVEFEPEEAGPGVVIDLTLNVEDERDDAMIQTVELFMPEDSGVVVVDVPFSDPWGGTYSDTGITWSGGTEDGDQELAFTVGPTPDTPQRLQFDALVTYDDGSVDRWIEDFPEGGDEPEMPAPVLEVVEGGPGTVPETVAPDPTVAEGTSTIAPETTTTPTSAPESDDDEDDDDDDDDDGPNLGLIIGFAAIIAALGGLGYWFSIRNRS